MKSFRNHILIFFFIFCCKNSNSQVNLVLNGSFEDTITCSSHITYQLFPKNWWMFNTVDYDRFPFTFCANSGTSGTIPFNGGGYQYPHSGNSYVGVVTILSISAMKYYREYIQTQLMNTLTSGKTYCVSFWYNEGNSTRYAIDKLGIYFSLNGINLTTTSTFTQYNPQITTPPGQFLNDTLNWHQYRTTYTATGNEVYLTLGNFNDSVQTNTQLYPNSSGPYADSYYLFDDISIIPTDLPAVAGKDTSVCKYDSVYIGRPKEIGLDNIWTEITTHTQVGVGAGIWLKSDTSATYVVTQNLCGTITTDTIRVVVNCEVGIGNFINEYGIKIYPNPVNDFITIESRQLKAEITLCDIIGNEILKVKSVKETKIDVSNLSEGIYFVGIRTRDGFISKKIIIQH